MLKSSRIEEIFSDLKGGKKPKEIIVKFGISRVTFRKVVRNTIYGDIHRGR